MKRTIWKVIFGLSLCLLLLIGAANWFFPKEVIPTGEYYDYADRLPKEITITVSDEANPLWVQTFQEGAFFWYLVGVIGMIVSVANLTTKPYGRQFSQNSPNGDL